MQNIVILTIPVITSILFLTVLVDVVLACIKIHKMNQLMSIVKKGELSYRQFLNKMDKMVDEF